MSKTILITGANRGIGEALARQYHQRGWQVLAAVRQLGAALPPQIEQFRLDLMDPKGPVQLAQQLKGRSIDILWLNAGVYAEAASRLGQIDAQSWQECLTVNALAPLLMAEAFGEHLQAGSEPKLLATSSTMGSLSENQGGGSYAYRASKAALNMTFVTLSKDLGPRGIICTLFCPGWVRTRMGGQGAPLSAEDSARGMIAQAERLSASDNGAFMSHQGRSIPW
ncbi:MAG: SDR family oxidoreductase [bacterium]|nr:SDR family oxidoreductase [bacterium]